jgi:hypothetical protein
MRDSKTQDQSLPPSFAHDTLDAALVALAATHRQLAGDAADLLRRLGFFAPLLADIGQWHDAQLRFGYYTLISANRCAGALARHALDGRRRG